MKITLHVLFIFAVIAGLSLSVYLLASIHTYRLGFPLDDAWIHQTYARNLALWSEWAFIRGQPSAGSTAPLWSAILAMGYLLKVNLYLWTFSRRLGIFNYPCDGRLTGFSGIWDNIVFTK